MKTNQVVLYGIGGPDKGYRVLSYFVIVDTSHDIVNKIWNTAARLRAMNPSIQKVYAIDNRRGLQRDFNELAKDSMKSHILFKDILEREARLIPV